MTIVLQSQVVLLCERFLVSSFTVHCKINQGKTFLKTKLFRVLSSTFAFVVVLSVYMVSLEKKECKCLGARVYLKI